MAKQTIEYELNLKVDRFSSNVKRSKGELKDLADAITTLLRGLPKKGPLADAFEKDIKAAKALRSELQALDKVKQKGGTVSDAQSNKVQQKAHLLVQNVASTKNKAIYDAERAAIEGLTLAEKEAIATQLRFDQTRKMGLKAVNDSISSEKQMSQYLITGRYALYDMSSALRTVSTNLLDFTKAAYDAQFAQEAAFSQVQRVQVGQDPAKLKALKEELIDLTKAIPKSFEEISKIAMLGSQLGIATENLAGFTDTVAKFSAITGVSVDQTATTFGKLANLLKISASEYDNLGSSIAYVGVQAAATETDILSTSRQISAVGTAAGLSSSDVIGLASAMASLGTAPEEARGVLVPTFNAMSGAIRSFSESTGVGNDDLTIFASTAGMTSKEFVDAWGDKKKGGATAAFKAFIAGLGKGDASKILNQLSLDGIRTSKGLTALGDNAAEVFKQMDAAATGMVMGDYLDKAFAQTVDDIAVRLQLLGAAVTEMFAAMAGNEQILAALGGAIDGLKNIISAFSDGLKGPFTSGVAGVILGITALIGSLLGIGAVAALSVASIYAMRVALKELMTDAAFANSGIIQFLAGLVKIPITSTAAATSVRVLNIAMKSLLIGMPVLLLVTMAAEAAFGAMGNSAESAAEKTKKYFGDLSGLRDAMMIDTSSFENGGKAIATFTVSTAGMTDEQKKASRMASDFAQVLGEVGNAADTASGKAKESALAFGETALEYTRNQLKASDEFKKAFESPLFAEYFTSIGGDINKAIEIGAKYGEDAVQGYFNRIEQKAIDSGKKVKGLNIWKTFTGDMSATRTSELENSLNPLITALGGLKDTAAAAANEVKVFGKTDQEVAQDAADLTSELLKQYDAMMKVMNIGLDTKDAMFTLGKSIKENGDNFDSNTEAGRNNIKAMEGVIKSIIASGGSSEEVAAKLAGLKQALVTAGIVGAAGIGLIDSAITEFGGHVGKVTAEDIKALIEGFNFTASSAGTAKTALEKLQDQIEKLFKAMDRKINLADSMSNLGQTIKENGKTFTYFSKAGRDNLKAVKDAIDAVAENSNGNKKKFANDLAAMRKAMIQAGITSGPALAMIDKAMKAIGTKGKASKGDIKDFFKYITTGAAEASASVRTLSDYADELASVLERTMQIKFGEQIALDGVISAFDDLTKSVQDAKDAIAEAKVEILGLTAEKADLEYQLNLAIKYGDELNAAALRAKIAENAQKLAEAERKAAEAQNATNLTGTDSTSIDNRSKVRGILSEYITLIKTLAETGNFTEAELASKATEMGKDFHDKLIALGFKEEDIAPYVDMLSNTFTGVIEKVQKGTTLKVNTDPALRALDEFVKTANGKLNKINTVTVKVKSGKTVTETAVETVSQAVIAAGAATGVNVAGVSANAAPYTNALNTVSVAQGVSMQQSASATSSVISLSPDDRALLRAAIDRPVNLYTDNQKIAQSANAGNVTLAQRGIR